MYHPIYHMLFLTQINLGIKGTIQEWQYQEVWFIGGHLQAGYHTQIKKHMLGAPGWLDN